MALRNLVMFMIVLSPTKLELDNSYGFWVQVLLFPYDFNKTSYP